MRKKIPYGKQNFEWVIMQNYYYIDRTEYIEKLESLNETNIVFLRPRKFGKTLFLDTLSKYYDINYADKFDALFKDLYIGKNPTPLKNSYYILYMNFSGVQTEDRDVLIRSFKSVLITSLTTFNEQYDKNIIIKEEYTEPADILREFLAASKKRLDKPIYLLIDEYDHFANELLSFNLDLFKDSVTKHGFVRKFYEEIKKGTQTIIERLFMTGVSPIMLDSLTSGFNITMSITTKPEFNEMLGFKEEEVKELLEYYDIYSEKLLKEMQENYNGYRFNIKAKNRVYNPDMVFYFIIEYLREQMPPEKIIDDNIMSDYKKVQNLFSLGELLGVKIDKNNKKELTEKEKQEEKESPKKIIGKLLNEILLTGRTTLPELTTMFNPGKRIEIKDIKSLLFYLGFMTFEKEGLRTYLKIPNYSMKKIFSEYFTEYIEERLTEYIDTDEIENAIITILEDGKIEPFAKEIENLLSKMDNRIFMGLDEKYIKAIMYSYLVLTPYAMVKMEYPVENGYIDIVMFKRYEEVPYEAIIEVKYIKQKEYTEEKLKRKIKEAKEQIEKYKKSYELNSKNETMKKFIIIFVGKEAKYVEEVK
ncbi:PD-(D/E)XK nuclease superfamily protein [Marinitoga hydrogenitolerans DSM 16785]|uniref:PD-(D/E)XK nuclease superfamily protein n=1 Tax=Marinitoga hydrogenitolerans (strain DSM 16785 / JCM 12826 / AT1271) TaxID=1122195 RepID=A0A1M4ZZ67_MARH1|nr:AAA family ATPase [Marinitoga hydrogenitolerans]SHF22956.1 PD-(D/E)XK nuclease superfamily protein [Marinitoga hydrogenitolerans DSM 16785]